jgi:hypothetical protein
MRFTILTAVVATVTLALSVAANPIACIRSGVMGRRSRCCNSSPIDAVAGVVDRRQVICG